MKRDVLRRGDPAALVQHRPALALVFPPLGASPAEILPQPEALAPLHERVLLVGGSHDEYCSVTELKRLADRTAAIERGCCLAPVQRASHFLQGSTATSAALEVLHWLTGLAHGLAAMPGRDGVAESCDLRGDCAGELSHDASHGARNSEHLNTEHLGEH